MFGIFDPISLALILILLGVNSVFAGVILSGMMILFKKGWVSKTFGRVKETGSALLAVLAALGAGALGAGVVLPLLAMSVKQTDSLVIRAKGLQERFAPYPFDLIRNVVQISDEMRLLTEFPSLKAEFRGREYDLTINPRLVTLMNKVAGHKDQIDESLSFKIEGFDKEFREEFSGFLIKALYRIADIIEIKGIDSREKEGKIFNTAKPIVRVMKARWAWRAIIRGEKKADDLKKMLEQIYKETAGWKDHDHLMEEEHHVSAMHHITKFMIGNKGARFISEQVAEIGKKDAE